MDARRGPFLMSLVLVACGASMTVDGNVVRTAKGVAFRIGDVPASWNRVKASDGAIGFNDAAGATVMVDGHCKMQSDDVPLVALTSQLLIGTTERKYDKEDVIPFDGREARHTVMRAKLDGVPLVWDVYVMKKNGCVYDMVYVASPARFETGAAAFERFVAGFRTLEDGT